MRSAWMFLVGVFALGSGLAVFAALEGLGPLYLVALCLVPGSLIGLVKLRRHRQWLKRLAADLTQLAEGGRRVRTVAEAGLAETEEISSALHHCARAMDEADSAKLSMAQMALTDALTGLANRRGLNNHLRELASRAAEPDQLVALMHADLDHFKAINDRLGHDAGDFVLCAAAARIQATLGPDDLLARVGGDEFIMVIIYNGGPEALTRRAAGLVRLLHEPIVYEHNTCTLGMSVGVVASGTIGKLEEPSRMLTNADLALTRAKGGGRGRYVIFDPSMARNHEKEREVATELHNAFGTDAFEAWFQPMVQADTGKLTGVEMLVRWRHPKRGLLAPSKFLAIAESRNLTQEISAETIPLACRTYREWLDSGLDVPRLYLNLSRSELVLPGLVDHLRWVLDDADIAPHRIAVEVEEEECSGRGAELIFENLSSLHELGVEIVLEGFGATDASIANVIRLGVSKIKLSRTIVDRMRVASDHGKVLPLLRGMIGFGTELGIVMVGKGVTVPSQLSTLRNLGCSELQGDAIAPAMSANDTRRWIGHFNELTATSAFREPLRHSA